MALPTCTVLIVENFLPDRELYRRCLLTDPSCDYRLLEVDTAGAGLELCRTQAIDAILLDYSLPDSNGLEFLQALNAQTHAKGNGSSPPVVIVTGQGDESVAVRAIKLGAEDYLVKRRLTPDLLRLTVRSAIENARLRLQLQRSDDRFRISIENLLDCFAICSALRSPDGKILDFRVDYLNAAALHSAQKTAADFGRGLCEMFPAHRETGLFDEYCRVVETGVPLVKEDLIYTDILGTQFLTRTFDIRASKLDDGLVLSWRDVTAHKQAEQDRDRFFNLSMDMLAIADFDGRFLRLNPAWEKTLGFTAAELTAQPSFEFIYPDDRAATIAVVEKLSAGQIAVNFENRYRCKDGSYRWLEWNAIPDPNQQLIYAIARDVTEQKQTQEIVRRQLAQLEAIYATAPIGLCFLDRDRRFVQLNDRLAEINGLSVADHLGKTLRELLPELAEQQEPIFQQILETRQPILDVEIHGSTPAHPGIARDWLVSYYPLIAADQEAIGINIMVQEITERKRTEAERTRLLAQAEAARQEAEAANRSKDEFITLVAHELRSPLNAILGWAKLLQTRHLDAATTTKALETIARNTQAQAQLVDDLLDVSRMVRGTLQLTFTQVNLVDVIEAAVETIRPIAEAKPLQLSLHLPSSAPVNGDFNRLQQIILNLLTNAIKFTPAGGQVEVRLEQEPCFARLTITDTGKGIPPEFLPFVFDRFRQDQQTATAREGLGLGLAIVRHLVELHSGSVMVSSAGVGQGATFTVRLPLLQTGEAGEQESGEAKEVFESSREQPLAGIWVLAVDDEPDMLDLTAFLLETAGAIVLTTNSAASALAQLPQFKPDIVLSDIAMPEQDGYALLRQIRSIRPQGQVPVIALTAFASHSRREEAIEAGFQQYLVKPVEPAQLVSAILGGVAQKL